MNVCCRCSQSFFSTLCPARVSSQRVRAAVMWPCPMQALHSFALHVASSYASISSPSFSCGCVPCQSASLGESDFFLHPDPFQAKKECINVFSTLWVCPLIRGARYPARLLSQMASFLNILSKSSKVFFANKPQTIHVIFAFRLEKCPSTPVLPAACSKLLALGSPG